MQSKSCVSEILHYAAKTPEQTAIQTQNHQLSYAQLAAHVMQLAGYLASLHLDDEAVIAVAMTPDIESIISLLAIWHMGYTYLPIPLHQGVSEQRLVSYLTQAQPSCILSQVALTRFAFLEVPVLNVRDFLSRPVDYRQDQSGVAYDPRRRAYIMFTSGSTGEPKGVEIEHRGIFNVMQAHIDLLHLGNTDRIAQFASMGFDAHLVEILVPLIAGGTCVIVPKTIRLDPKQVGQFYQTQRVTGAIFTPSMLSVLKSDDFTALRFVLSTGEKISDELFHRWVHDQRVMVNGYGPTEVTICSTLAICTKETGIHIGQPIPGIELSIIDAEMVIRGIGLARGYLNQPDITNERFQLLSEDDQVPNRVYFSGDIGHYDAATQRFFITVRKDRQVKIHGKLFHPSEIDRHVEATDGVLHSYTVIDVVDGRPKIDTYLQTQGPLDQERLYWMARKLAEVLAFDLVPHRWHQVEHWPLTPNRKLDVATLLSQQSQYPIWRTQHPVRIVPEPLGQTPATVTEQVVKMWQDILELDMPSSMTDHFFFLGGTSILAVQFLERLHDSVPVANPISIVQFIQSPTLGSILHAISCQSAYVGNKPIATIKHSVHSSKESSLFLVHTLSGDEQGDYLKFAQAWRYHTRLYAIEPLGRSGCYQPTSLAEMARINIDAVKRVQTRGPYYLGGWSLGGLISAEMARQMVELGDQVTVFAFDTFLVDHSMPQEHAQLLSTFAQTQYPHVTLTEDLSPFGLHQQVSRLFAALVDQLPAQRVSLNAQKHLLIAAIDAPRPEIEFPFYLFATASSQRAQRRPYLGWPEHGVTLLRDPDNDHFSLFTNETAVQQLAKQVHEVIQAQREEMGGVLLLGNDFQLPEANLDYVDRAQAAEVLNAIQTARVKVTGSGGLGKTQLLLNYAHRLLETKQVDLVLWFQAEPAPEKSDVDELLVQFQTLAQRLGIDPNGMQKAELVKLVYQSLQHKNKKCFVVIDGARDYLSIKAYMPPSSFAVAVSTRDPSYWGARFTPVPMSLFTLSEAISYARDVFSRSDYPLTSDREIETLVTVLGLYPLAITHALAFIIHHTRSISAYLERYNEHKNAVLCADHFQDDLHQVSICATIDVAKQSLTPTAQTLLNTISFVASEVPVDNDLFKPMVGGDVFLLDQLIGAVHRTGLISFTNATGRIFAHQMVQDVLRAGIVASDQAALLKQFVPAVSEYYGKQTFPGQDFRRRTRLMPHLESLRNKVTTDCDQHKIDYMIAKNYLQMGQYTSAVRTMRSAVLGLEKAGELSSFQLGKMYHNLGKAYHADGEYEQASPMLAKALALLTSVPNVDGIEVAKVQTSLASNQMMWGQYELAEPLLVAANKTMSALSLPKQFLAVPTYIALGTLYHHRGAFLEQIKALRRGLDIQETHYGEEHGVIAMSLNNLGIALSAMDRHGEAIKRYQRAERIATNAYGPNHITVVKIRINKACAMMHQQQLSDAIEIFQDAIVPIRQYYQGKTPLELAKVLTNLGNAYYRQKAYKKSVDQHTEAVRVMRAFFGERSHIILPMLMNKCAALMAEKISHRGVDCLWEVSRLGAGAKGRYALIVHQARQALSDIDHEVDEWASKAYVKPIRGESIVDSLWRISMKLRELYDASFHLLLGRKHRGIRVLLSDVTLGSILLPYRDPSLSESNPLMQMKSEQVELGPIDQPLLFSPFIVTGEPIVKSPIYREFDSVFQLLKRFIRNHDSHHIARQYLGYYLRQDFPGHHPPNLHPGVLREAIWRLQYLNMAGCLPLRRKVFDEVLRLWHLGHVHVAYALCRLLVACIEDQKLAQSDYQQELRTLANLESQVESPPRRHRRQSGGWFGAHALEVSPTSVADQQRAERTIKQMGALSNPQSHSHYGQGAWDAAPAFDVLTGVPVHTYRVMRHGETVGTVTFYHTRVLCRSEDATRDNIVAMTGIFQTYQDDLERHRASIPDICAVLPPTTWEICQYAMIQSAQIAGPRGAANALSREMQRHQYSATATVLAKDTLLYGGYFVIRFAHRYYDLLQQGEHNALLPLAGRVAGQDLVSLCQMTILLEVAALAPAVLRRMADRYEANRVRRLADVLSGLCYYGLTGYRAFTYGVDYVVTGMVTGVAVEKVAEWGSGLLFGWFGGASHRSTQPSDPSTAHSMKKTT